MKLANNIPPALQQKSHIIILKFCVTKENQSQIPLRKQIHKNISIFVEMNDAMI